MPNVDSRISFFGYEELNDKQKGELRDKYWHLIR